MSTIKHSVIAHVDQTTLLDANDKLQARKNINAVASLFSFDSKYLSISDTTDGKIDFKLNTGNTIANGTGIALNFNADSNTVELGHVTTTAITPGAYKVGVDKLGHLVCSGAQITASDVGAAEAIHSHGYLDNDGKMTNTPVNVANGGRYAIAVAQSAGYKLDETYLKYASNLYIDYSDTSRDRMYLGCTMQFLYEPLIGNGLRISDTTNKYVDINYDSTTLGVASNGQLYVKSPHVSLSDYSSTYKDTVPFGAYKFACSEYGHITNVVALTKTDLTNLGLAGSNTTYTFTTGTQLGSLKVNGTDYTVKGIKSAAGKLMYLKSKTMAGSIPPVAETLNTAVGTPLKWVDKPNFSGSDSTIGLTTYPYPLGTMAFAKDVDNKTTKGHVYDSDSTYIVFSLKNDYATGTYYGGPFSVSAYKIEDKSNGPIGIQADNKSIGSTNNPVYYDVTTKSFKACNPKIRPFKSYIHEYVTGKYTISDFTSDGIFTLNLNVTNSAAIGDNSVVQIEFSMLEHILNWDNVHTAVKVWIGTESFGTGQYKLLIPTSPSSGSFVISSTQSAAYNGTGRCTLFYTISSTERANEQITLKFKLCKLSYPTATTLTTITSSNKDTFLITTGTPETTKMFVSAIVRELGIV